MGFDVTPVAGIAWPFKGRGEWLAVGVLEVAPPAGIGIERVDHGALVKGALRRIVEGEEELEPSAVRCIEHIVELVLDLPVGGVLRGNVESEAIDASCSRGFNVTSPVVLSVAVRVANLINVIS